jgi:RsmE family RNA methyltransferase
MNLLLLEDEDFPDGPPPRSERARIEGRRHRHVLAVHRAAVGDELCIGLLDGRMGTAHIVGLDSTAAELDVVLDRYPPPKLPVTLVLALQRPKAFARVLSLAASIGVARIEVINAWRVEKSFWKSSAVDTASIARALRLGLEQSRDTVPPPVRLHRLFRPFVEDELPGLANTTTGLVAHPPARSPCPRALDGPVTLAVGPEGGFLDYEIERLAAAGLNAVSLGQRALRTEVALAALLGRIF